MYSFSLKSKTILITGASSGIGKACVLAADKMGASVILLGRNEERLKETIAATNNKDLHQYFSIDLTDYKSVNEIFSQFKNQKIKLHGIINAAGISTTLPLKRSTPEKILQFTNINVAASINISQLATQKYFLSDQGASVIFISSVMGMVGETGKTLYSITKGALIAAARSMAVELASKKVRVNCVSPGVVDSPMSKSAVYNRDEEARQRIAELHPLGIGKTEDVAKACIFLLSDAARWVTGTNLVVDGGYTAR